MGANGFSASESKGRVRGHAMILQEGHHRWQETGEKSAAVIKLTTQLWQWYLQGSSGAEAMPALPAFHSNSAQGGAVGHMCPTTLFWHCHF